MNDKETTNVAEWDCPCWEDGIRNLQCPVHGYVPFEPSIREPDPDIPLPPEHVCDEWCQVCEERPGL